MIDDRKVTVLRPGHETVRIPDGHHYRDDAYYSHGGGNGGGDGMLEARVAKLEANVEHIASDTNEIKLNLRVTSSDMAELKTDTALSKRDIADIKADTSSLKQDFLTMNGRVSGLETSIDSFKTTIKVSAGIISAAVVVFGVIAGPYLAKIASILNDLALKS